MTEPTSAAPAGAAAAAGAPATRSPEAYVTVALTIPAALVAEFYQQAAQWLADSPRVDPKSGRGWTRTS